MINIIDLWSGKTASQLKENSLPSPQETCDIDCPSSSPSDSEWMSALGALGAPGSTSARISWSEDMFQDAPRYIVQYKRSGTEDALISIDEVQSGS